MCRAPWEGRPDMGKMSRLGNDLYQGRKSIDFVGRPWFWYAVSVCIIALALSGVVFRGLNFGVEFTGGRAVAYTTDRPVDIGDARSAVARAGFPQATVQTSGEDGIAVRTTGLTDAQEKRIRDALARQGGGGGPLDDFQCNSCRSASIAFRLK